MLWLSVSIKEHQSGSDVFVLVSVVFVVDASPLVILLLPGWHARVSGLCYSDIVVAFVLPFKRELARLVQPETTDSFGRKMRNIALFQSPCSFLENSSVTSSGVLIPRPVLTLAKRAFDLRCCHFTTSRPGGSFMSLMYQTP